MAPPRHRALLLLAAAAAAFTAGCEPPPPETPPPPPPKPPVAQAPVAPPGPTRVEVSLEDVGLDGSALDRSVNPCDDFYQFACGGWLARTPIPGDKPTWSRSFSEIFARNEAELRRILDDARANAAGGDPVRQKLGAFYGACMDESAGTKPLEGLLRQARGVRTMKSLAQSIAALHRERVWALFDISDDQDYKDATRVLASLDQNGLGLPDRDSYTDTDDKAKELRQKYVEHVERMLKLAGQKPGDAKRAASDVLRIETELARVSRTRVERRDPKVLYNKIDLAGLAKAAPDFPWDDYFSAIGFPDIKDVNVTSVKFFEGMNALLRSVKPAEWQSYLSWHIIRSLAPALPKAVVDESFALEREITGQPAQRERWKRCIDATDSALGELLAQPYVEARFNKDSKEAVEKMVFAIRDAFGRELDGLSWMDPTTKARAHEKLAKMAYLIGYPDKWIKYDFDLDPKSYSGNLIAARAFEQKRRLSKVGKPVDRSEWQMTPPTVNAYYEPLKNHMVFPAGILQPPFYTPTASVAVNLGGMGMVVGHELTHGFDDEGSQFDGDGNLANWWDPAVRKSFDDRAACVAAQFDGYSALPDVKVNGKLTLGEDIADLGGVKLAFQAYRKLRAGAPETTVAGSFNEDQQFFVSVGQVWCSKYRDEYARQSAKTNPHAPPRFRVNGSLSNLPEFSEAFSCGAAAPMRSAPACGVW